MLKMQTFFPSNFAVMKKPLILFALIFIFSAVSFAQSYNDAALKRTIEQDRGLRAAQGRLPVLTVAEHLYRADVYMANRHFPEAREHWQKIIDNYPSDAAAMPPSLSQPSIVGAAHDGPS